MTALPRRSALRRLGALGLGLAVGTAADAAPASTTESRRIEQLIAYVEGQAGIAFVRNGKSYTPAQAGRFLRGKLDAMGKDVRTAREFIAQIATKSSTSGKPYTVVGADGRSVPAAEFLGDELARIERAP